MVKLMYYGDMRDCTGCREETSDAPTMRELLKELSQRHGPAALKAAKRSVVTLDGVRAERLNSREPLPASCTVCFFPLCSGG